jgi:hypothetical protein
MTAPSDLRRSLVAGLVSRQNKLWIAAGWKGRGWFIEWRWAGEPMRSRLLFQFEPDDKWHEAKSYDEDVKPFLKWAKEMT